MKVINNFTTFVSELILEENMKLKVSKFELILSKKLREILLKMDHQIADDLIGLHRDPSLKHTFDRTFLDLGDQPGDISFIMANKIPELVEPELVHGDYKRLPSTKKLQSEYLDDEVTDIDNFEYEPLGDFEYTEVTKNPWISDYNHVTDLHDIQFTDKNHPVWSKNRTNQKASRVINSLFPKKYPHNFKRDERPVKPNDIETFQDQFTAIVEENSKKIKQVYGDEIVYYYNEDRYQLGDKGTLGNSCMRLRSRCTKYLPLYTENPDKVSMLVLFPEGVDGKIIGRAILWKLDTFNGEPVDDKYFMDRIYTANSSDEFIFMEYAKKHGYYYKSVQSYGTNYDIVSPDGTTIKVEMSVNVPSKKQYGDGVGYEYYPYVDTLQFFSTKDGELTNKMKPNKKYGQLTSTGGDIE